MRPFYSTNNTIAPNRYGFENHILDVDVKILSPDSWYRDDEVRHYNKTANKNGTFLAQPGALIGNSSMTAATRGLRQTIPLAFPAQPQALRQTTSLAYLVTPWALMQTVP